MIKATNGINFPKFGEKPLLPLVFFANSAIENIMSSINPIKNLIKNRLLINAETSIIVDFYLKIQITHLIVYII